MRQNAITPKYIVISAAAEWGVASFNPLKLCGFVFPACAGTSFAGMTGSSCSGFFRSPEPPCGARSLERGHVSEFFTHSYSVFTCKANSKAGNSPPARVSHASAFLRDREQTELAHPEPLGVPLPASLGALLRHTPYAGRIASVVDQLIL
jgi:hypothetical protein